MSKITVAKFGGTSVASPETPALLLRTLTSQGQGLHVVVLSALAGVTDLLEQLASASWERDQAICETLISDIEQRHVAFLAALGIESFPDEVSSLFHQLQQLGFGDGEPSFEAWRDEIRSFGERLSTTLYTDILQRAGAPVFLWDAREIVVTDSGFGDAEPDLPATRSNFQRAAAELPETAWVLIQGFIGADSNGHTTTLGRGGSDYSATLLGAAASAQEVVIWTDVPGVLSADPRVVPDPLPIRHLTFHEAEALAFFGARVLHGKCIEPARIAKIPVRVKSVFEPDDEGTLIHEDFPSRQHVFAISSLIDKVEPRQTRQGTRLETHLICPRLQSDQVGACEEIALAETDLGPCDLKKRWFAQLDARPLPESLHMGLVIIMHENLHREALLPQIAAHLRSEDIPILQHSTRETQNYGVLMVPCEEIQRVVRLVHQFLRRHTTAPITVLTPALT